MPDWLRLTIGTFTRIPVPAPRSIDGTTTRWAMISAPIVGAALGAVTGLPLLLPTENAAFALLLAAIAVAAGAVATRALHWDGLADTVDAIASGKPPAQALEIARRSDLGPMGALALILVAVIQVSGLASLTQATSGYWVWILACTVGRIGVVFGCTRGVPAAREDGLGAAVAGSVPRPASVLWAVGVVVVGALGVWQGNAWLAAGFGGLVGAWAVVSYTRRRFGGITGDILGATVEVAATSVIVMAALVVAVG